MHTVLNPAGLYDKKLSDLTKGDLILISGEGHESIMFLFLKIILV